MVRDRHRHEVMDEQASDLDHTLAVTLGAGWAHTTRGRVTDRSPWRLWPAADPLRGARPQGGPHHVRVLTTLRTSRAPPREIPRAPARLEGTARPVTSVRTGRLCARVPGGGRYRRVDAREPLPVRAGPSRIRVPSVASRAEGGTPCCLTPGCRHACGRRPSWRLCSSRRRAALRAPLTRPPLREPSCRRSGDGTARRRRPRAQRAPRSRSWARGISPATSRTPPRQQI